MISVNIHQAKTHLSRYVEAVESGAEPEIVIARNGRPAVRMVPLETQVRLPVRWGLAEGKYDIPDSIDDLNPEIAKLFYGDNG